MTATQSVNWNWLSSFKTRLALIGVTIALVLGVGSFVDPLSVRAQDPPEDPNVEEAVRVAGTAAGSVAGAAVGSQVGKVVGAALGSAFAPGIGTAVGAAAGAVIGYVATSVAIRFIDSAYQDRPSRAEIRRARQAAYTGPKVRSGGSSNCRTGSGWGGRRGC